jgi:hypothetical protein
MKSNFNSPAIWVLSVSFTVSVIALVIFLAESDFSDKTLFLLLAVLRYSSFLLCISSVFLTVTGFKRVVHKPSVLPVFGVVLTFCLTLFGLGIILVDAFILSITGGKG